MAPIKVIDLFAGPGGLGEGFTTFRTNAGLPCFDVVFSAEREASAHRTLTLRSLFRQYSDGGVPEAYYAFMRGELGKNPEDELYRLPEIQDGLNKAKQEARQLELGKKGNHASVYKEIRSALKGEDFVLLGGPPCQAYSLVGRSRNQGEKGKIYDADQDHRNFLYVEYLRIIAKFQPLCFIMENVKGLLSAKTSAGPVFPRIMSDLADPGKSCSTKPDLGRSGHRYKIFSFVEEEVADLFGETRTTLKPQDYIIQSELYGIPQARHRVILFGIREDLANAPPEQLKQSVIKSTVHDAISDLPELRSGLSKEEDNIETWRAIRNGMPKALSNASSQFQPKITDIYEQTDLGNASLGRGGEFEMRQKNLTGSLHSWYADPRLGMHITNHSTRGHIRGDLQRYWFAAAFCKAKGFSPKAQSFPEELHPNHANFTSGNFADRFRVQTWGAPSTTVTSHISKDGHYFIHPDIAQMRSLTVREAARLQTFPDNYHFVGNRTDQYVQVGNAVPPLLAAQLAKVVASQLAR